MLFHATSLCVAPLTDTWCGTSWPRRKVMWLLRVGTSAVYGTSWGRERWFSSHSPPVTPGETEVGAEPKQPTLGPSKCESWIQA